MAAGMIEVMSEGAYGCPIVAVGRKVRTRTETWHLQRRALLAHVCQARLMSQRFRFLKTASPSEDQENKHELEWDVLFMVHEYSVTGRSCWHILLVNVF